MRDGCDAGALCDSGREAEVNRYNRYPGDYLRATSDLNLAEHGAYTLLLDWYYSNERPIDDSRKFQVARATSEDEQKITQWVLNRFFIREERDVVVWVHPRAEAEIAKARPRINAAKNNGNGGGRPKLKPRTKPSGFSKNNPVGFATETHAGGGGGGGIVRDPSSGVGVVGERSSPSCSQPPSVVADLPVSEGSREDDPGDFVPEFELPPALPPDSPRKSGIRRSEPPPIRSLADRAAEIVQRDADRTWVSFQAPQKWPEVVAIAEALAAAEERPTPALGPYHTDAGVRAVVGILASGASVETICAALPRVVADEWWQRERPSMRALSIDRIRAAQGPINAPISRLNPRAKELAARTETDVERIRRAAEFDAAGIPPPDPIEMLRQAGRVSP